MTNIAGVKSSPGFMLAGMCLFAVKYDSSITGGSFVRFCLRQARVYTARVVQRQAGRQQVARPPASQPANDSECAACFGLRRGSVLDLLFMLLVAC